jgi:hypothetical protein
MVRGPRILRILFSRGFLPPNPNERKMMTRFWTWLKGAWKAVAAAASPFVAALAANISDEIQGAAATITTAAVAALLVYVVPNKPS